MTPEENAEEKYWPVVQAVYKEVLRAKTMFKEDFVNQHEGYAVILEELDELWEEVKKNQKIYDLPAQRKEVIQCAAMCIRFAAELIDKNEQLKSSPSPTPQKEYTDKELNDFACDVSLSTIFPESAQERSKEELGNWKERLEVEVLQEIGDYGLTGGECIMIERWIEENLLIKSNSTPVQEGLREDEKWKKNTFEDNDGH